jgi:signal transduction histidine kinase
MFKSVFAKYVTAFMMIIMFGFAVLLLIVTSIVGNYAYMVRVERMDYALNVAQEYIENQLKSQESITNDDLIEIGQNETLSDMLSVFFEKKNKIEIVIADSHGKVLSVVGGEPTKPMVVVGSVLPEELVTESVLNHTLQKTIEGADAGSVLVRSVGLIGKSGSVDGMIAVCSVNTYWDTMVEELSKTIITSALLVLFATMIAAYFITERTTEPLRQMSRAARSFAAGNFESRVKVSGNDEVAELAEAFNQMAESLTNLENMRNTFIANVSHDLRTPMTTIAGFIDGIRDGVIPKDEHGYYLDIISKEVQRLSRLVSSLLDLSRIQAGDRKFVMRPFDICEMSRLILISFEKQIDEKRLEVEFNCDSERMMVNADHDAIYQIFYNICHNAIKFSKEGGLLRISVTEEKDRKIRVAVFNEGQGIPKADLPFVFERFYKTDKSRGLDKSGVGLGLFISKTIIAAHNEKIWVSSEEGKSCEFCFTLARAPHILLHGQDAKDSDQ